MQTFVPTFVLRRGRFCFKFLALFDQRINNIELTSGFQLRAKEGQHFAQF